MTIAVMPLAQSDGSPAVDSSSSLPAVASPNSTSGTTSTDSPTPTRSESPAIAPTGVPSPPVPDSSPAAPDTAPASDAAEEANTATAALQPTALDFPAAAIDMEILSLTLSDAELESQQLVPPLTLNAYWLTPYGFPGSDSEDTTYIVGHSWDGKDAPFNRLSDEALTGTEFTLTTASGDIAYVVDSVITHDKDTLKDSDIWDIVPHRVVLISCYTEDPWGKNVVVTASPRTA